MAPNYYIILLSDGLVLVPSTWLTDDQKLCYWPNKYTKPRIDTAIRNEEKPQISKDWSLYRVTKIYGSADNFEQGLMKLKKCEYESDLESGHATNDDYDEDCQKKTRSTRAARKNSSDSDELDNYPMNTQRCGSKSSKLPQPENATLSFFPDPPQSLNVTSNDLNSHDDPPCIKRRDQPQKPIIVATFDSPIINEKLMQKNRNTVHRPVADTTNFPMDHNENVLSSHGDLTPQRRPPNQQSRYTPITTESHETDFKKEILRKLNKLMLDVAVIKETQLRMLQSEENHIGYHGDLEILKDFPLNTLQQLQQIEIKLEDKTFFKELVKMLSGVGGHDVNNTTTNVLKKLLSNALAVTYSLQGKKNKKSFSELKLKEVVIEAVRVHHKEATEMTIMQCVARWLVQAKQRHDREMEKLQRKDPDPLDK